MAARQRGALAAGIAARPQAGAAQDRHAAGAPRRSKLQDRGIRGEGRLDDGPRLFERETRLRGRGPRQVALCPRNEAGNDPALALTVKTNIETSRRNFMRKLALCSLALLCL